MKLVKRFKCNFCGYLSPGGYKVDTCNCPNCKSEMVSGIYKQYKNHCVLTPYKSLTEMLTEFKKIIEGWNELPLNDKLHIILAIKAEGKERGK